MPAHVAGVGLAPYGRPNHPQRMSPQHGYAAPVRTHKQSRMRPDRTQIKYAPDTGINSDNTTTHTRMPVSSCNYRARDVADALPVIRL